MRCGRSRSQAERKNLQWCDRWRFKLRGALPTNAGERLSNYAQAAPSKSNYSLCLPSPSLGTPKPEKAPRPRMSVDYLLKGRIGELASWRITTSENAVPRGFSRKRKLGEVEGELTLIRLRIDGFRGRHNQEDRRRKVVWRARSRLDAILSRADEEAAAQNLPIKVSCSSAEEESARPGYLARKMDEAVAQFAQVCMVEEGALPRPLKEPQVRPCAPAAAHVYKPFVYG